MEYAVVSVPAAPIRRKPNHRKEMVSQLLFGEMVKVLKTNGDLWVKIRSLHDGYEGWVTNTMCLLHNCNAVDKDICFWLVVDSNLKYARQKTHFRKVVFKFSTQ